MTREYVDQQGSRYERRERRPSEVSREIQDFERYIPAQRSGNGRGTDPGYPDSVDLSE